MVLLCQLYGFLHLTTGEFTDALSAKVTLLDWIGLCTNTATLVRTALCCREDARVAELLAIHLKSKAAGGPGIFFSSVERYRCRREAERLQREREERTLQGQDISSGGSESDEAIYGPWSDYDSSESDSSMVDYVEFPASD